MEKQQRQRTGRGKHSTSRQNKGKERKWGEGGGEKAHGTQPWQAEEQERKAEQATKQNQPAARQLNQDSKRKEQTHSEDGAREREGVGREEGEERGGKEKDGKEKSETLETHP